MKKFICLLFSLFFLFNHSLIRSQQSIQDLKQIVVKIGKLKFKTDIPVKYLNNKELREYVEEIFEKEYPDELEEKEQLFLQLMGFVQKKINIKKERRKITIDNAGGLYNEKTGELFALEKYRDTNYVNSMVIIHELRHGLQDQYFDLSKLLSACASSDFDDRRLALLAAIEGDATLVMVQYGNFNPEILTSYYDTEVLLSFSPPGRSARVSHASDIVKHQLIMPYIEGLKFVNHIFKKKKWKGVNQILKSPPVSTEQILHPKKYLKKEAPLRVNIGYRPEEYALYHSGVIGEYYLNILLLTKNMYRDYAAGWGGDRFEIYTNISRAQASYFFIWKSCWDKEEFCANFYQVFKSFIEKQYKINFREGKVRSNIFIAGKSSSDPDSEYFFISRLKNRIFYVRSNDRTQINKFIDGGNYD